MLVGLWLSADRGDLLEQNFGLQDGPFGQFGAAFKDFAGSIVVHAFGGWAALAAVLSSARARPL